MPDSSVTMVSALTLLPKKVSADLPVWQLRNGGPDGINVKMPPIGHYGDAEKEIGRVCVQLASPDFKYMSGETLTLEDGMGQRP